MAPNYVIDQDGSLAIARASDLVSVSNIQSIVNSGYDIWGREKSQPVLVSVTLSLAAPIHSAAASDSLDASTVHYGQLSKNIAAALEQPEPSQAREKDKPSTWVPPLVIAEKILIAAATTAVDVSSLALIEANVHFTKASRFGDGVRLRLFKEPSNPAATTILSLENVRISTLIGINSHERAMPQLVIVSAEIHNASAAAIDTYFELEQIVVKTVEESSFETLESLVEEIASRCTKFYIFPKMGTSEDVPVSSHSVGIRVRAEKPSAVLIAHAPAIEIFRACGPQDAYGKRMLVELGNKRPSVPFPLAGRLDEFLKSWKQD